MGVIQATFTVIYRWKVAAPDHEAFKQHWADLTRAIKHERGGLGSRLHLDKEGVFVAYAQWPDNATWQEAREQPSPLPKAGEAMSSLVVERFEPEVLDVVADLIET